MMEVIKKEEFIEEYELLFDYGDGSGFGFPCDANGKLKEMPEAAMANYKRCMEHPEKFARAGVVVDHSYIVKTRYGICPHCGRRVNLEGSGYMGAFDCECGKWYNAFGQELLPPDQWEGQIDDDY